MSARNSTVLILLFFAAYFVGWPSAEFYVFGARDYARAMNLLQGEWIWHGPEMTGGGYLFGPFYYWLLALGLAIEPTVFGPWIISCLLAAVAAWLVCASHTSRVDGWGLAAFTTTFVLWPFVPMNLGHQWNPSFLFLFMMGGSVALIRLQENLGLIRYWVAFFLCLWLSLQIHFLGSTLLMGLIALLLFERRNLPMAFKEGRFKIAAIVVVTIALLAPGVLQWAGPARELSLGLTPDKSPPLVWKIFVDSLRFNVFTTQLWQQPQKLVGVIFNVLIVFGPVLWFFSRRRYGDLKFFAKQDRWLLWYLLSTLPIALFGIGHINFDTKLRYCIPFYVIAALVVLRSFLRTLSSPNQGFREDTKTMASRRRGLVMPFVVTALVFRFVWPFYLDYSRPNIAKNWEKLAALSWVMEQTGWTAQLVQRRTFQIAINNETSFEYSLLGSRPALELSGGGPNQKLDLGVAVIVFRHPNWRDLSGEELSAWMKRFNVNSDLVARLESGSAEIVAQTKFGRLQVFLIKMAPSDVEPIYFHNWGSPYRKAPEQLAIERRLIERSRVLPISGLKIVEWNDCPDEAIYCKNFATIERSDTDPATLRVGIYGETLSQPAWIINPFWVQAIFDPTLHFECSSRLVEKALAPSVGFFMQRPRGIRVHGVLAPALFLVSHPCPENEGRIWFKYSSAKAFHHQREISLVSRELEFR